jgi:N6-adenosine-specific RNA methylase IME4
MSVPSTALFGVLYADPPWRYNFPGTRAEATKDYPTMSIADLCALRPSVADDAVLFLWAITQSLPDALRVLEAWGFKYKSSAVWDKGIPATGYWWRGQHELLLVGVRGQAKPPPPELRKPSVLRHPRGPHSAKPDVVREWIGAWYPAERKLEMFARPWTDLWPKHDGWDTWGNEMANDVELSTPNAGAVPRRGSDVGTSPLLGLSGSEGK